MPFVDWVRRNSPYYAELWDGIPSARWREFPVIDKAAMMANFDRLNTLGLSREKVFEVALAAEQSRDFDESLGDITVGLSSGTSGHRGLFLASPKERAMWAGTALQRVLGKVRKRQRIAFFLRANSQLYTSVESKLVKFRYFDLLAPMSGHVEALNELSPTLVIAPPSVLRMLAEAQREGRLRMRPDKMVSVAEVLERADQAFIEETFKQVVHQVYQCTEGFLGATCAHGTLHLNEDVVIIEREYIDESLRKFVPIVTDFRRTTQPIVRYRLNDILTERAEPCPCGSAFTAIERIEGRCDDLFLVPGRDGASELRPVFPDFVSRAVMSGSDDIRAYVVRQVAPLEVVVELEVDAPHREDAEAGVTRALSNLFERVECKTPRITFGAAPARDPLAKLRRVRREFEVPDENQRPELKTA